MNVNIKKHKLLKTKQIVILDHASFESSIYTKDVED